MFAIFFGVLVASPAAPPTTSLGAIGGPGASPGRAMPAWAYTDSPFPVGWFGANKSGFESEAQLEMLGNYSISIFGWQAFLDKSNYTHEAQDLVAQARVVKQRYPSQATAIYLDAELAEPFQTAVSSAMKDPAMEDFFLRYTEVPGPAGMITCNVFCRSMPGMAKTDPRCLAGYWNWFNASAVDYYLNEYVGPIAAEEGYDAIFFDGADEWLRQGSNSWKRAVNVPKGVTEEMALEAMTSVRVRTVQLLQKLGKYPIISEHIGDTSAPQQAYIEVMLNATQRSASPLPIMCRQFISRNLRMVDSIAAFLIGMGPFTYYSASTGWFDSDWVWHKEYAVDYGVPLGPAKLDGAIYTRDFKNCHVLVNCTVPSACRGTIEMKTAAAAMEMLP